MSILPTSADNCSEISCNDRRTTSNYTRKRYINQARYVVRRTVSRSLRLSSKDVSSCTGHTVRSDAGLDQHRALRETSAFNISVTHPIGQLRLISNSVHIWRKVTQKKNFRGYGYTVSCSAWLVCGVVPKQWMTDISYQPTVRHSTIIAI